MDEFDEDYDIWLDENMKLTDEDLDNMAEEFQHLIY